jgi:hypothetical protein
MTSRQSHSRLNGTQTNVRNAFEKTTTLATHGMQFPKLSASFELLFSIKVSAYLFELGLLYVSHKLNPCKYQTPMNDSGVIQCFKKATSF